MTSSAFSGVGTTFSRLDVAIAEISSISGPNMTRNTIDVTSLDSTGGYREFIAGFRDAGEVTLNMNFTIAGYLGMLDDFESEVLQTYQITLDESGINESEFEFTGLVTSLGMSVPMDDKVTSDVTIKISSTITITT